MYKRFLRFFLLSEKNKIKYLRKNGARIGENCALYCGVSAFGSEPYLINIGNNVTLASGCKILTHDGGVRVLCKAGFVQKADLFGMVTIGDNVFVGINSIIMPNVRIGNNVVIGAGAIVTKDVPNDTVVAGVPAKKVCSIEEYYDKHKNDFDYTRGFAYIEKKKYLYNKFNIKD